MDWLLPGLIGLGIAVALTIALILLSLIIRGARAYSEDADPHRQAVLREGKRSLAEQGAPPISPELEEEIASILLQKGKARAALHVRNVLDVNLGTASHIVDRVAAKPAVGNP